MGRGACTRFGSLVSANGRFLRHRPKRSERRLNYGRLYQDHRQLPKSEGVPVGPMRQSHVARPLRERPEEPFDLFEFICSAAYRGFCLPKCIVAIVGPSKRAIVIPLDRPEAFVNEIFRQLFCMFRCEIKRGKCVKDSGHYSLLYSVVATNSGQKHKQSLGFVFSAAKHAGDFLDLGVTEGWQKKVSPVRPHADAFAVRGDDIETDRVVFGAVVKRAAETPFGRSC